MATFVPPSTTKTDTTLSFPRATFAKLSPGPFLLAHLDPSSSASPVRRPNGRRTDEFRQPTLHTGSLSHADGSAVVRFGDTAAVCGVRAEILLASDIPGQQQSSDRSSAAPQGHVAAAAAQEMRDLGLLVPNVELSTGCSPAHLPGQAPSPLAQSLAVRLLSLLHCSKLVDVEDLRIWHQTPAADEVEQDDDEPPEPVVVAYWTLYIDVLFISLDGNPFDAAWAAVLAALRDVKLPSACWDVDRRMVLCEDSLARARKLHLRCTPMAATFSVFTTLQLGRPKSDMKGVKSWMLADPDTFEEELCNEVVTVVLDCAAGNRTRILKLEKSGGIIIDVEMMREAVKLAEGRWKDWCQVLQTILDRAAP